METTSLKYNPPGISYIAFFDLDRTIIGSNSGKILIRQAYHNGLMSWLDIIKGVYFSFLYQLDLKDTSRILKSMVSWLEGIPETSISDLSAEIFKDHLKRSIHKEVIAEIKFHKSRGARVVILSSSIYTICRNVADYLDIDDIICTKLEVSNGMYTGHTTGPICFGEEKVTQLKAYCTTNNLNSSDSWYYGDSISDFPALNITGNPVCINPDKKLKKEALKRQWKILQWN
jgi:HAD superfamily hydrolase (TIGR01490 family)